MDDDEQSPKKPDQGSTGGSNVNSRRKQQIEAARRRQQRMLTNDVVATNDTVLHTRKVKVKSQGESHIIDPRASLAADDEDYIGKKATLAGEVMMEDDPVFRMKRYNAPQKVDVTSKEVDGQKETNAEPSVNASNEPKEETEEMKKLRLKKERIALLKRKRALQKKKELEQQQLQTPTSETKREPVSEIKHEPVTPSSKLTIEEKRERIARIRERKAALSKQKEARNIENDSENERREKVLAKTAEMKKKEEEKEDEEDEEEEEELRRKEAARARTLERNKRLREQKETEAIGSPSVRREVRHNVTTTPAKQPMRTQRKDDSEEELDEVPRKPIKRVQKGKNEESDEEQDISMRKQNRQTQQKRYDESDEEINERPMKKQPINRNKTFKNTASSDEEDMNERPMKKQPMNRNKSFKNNASSDEEDMNERPTKKQPMNRNKSFKNDASSDEEDMNERPMKKQPMNRNKSFKNDASSDEDMNERPMKKQATKQNQFRQNNNFDDQKKKQPIKRNQLKADSEEEMNERSLKKQPIKKNQFKKQNDYSDDDMNEQPMKKQAPKRNQSNKNVSSEDEQRSDNENPSPELPVLTRKEDVIAFVSRPVQSNSLVRFKIQRMNKGVDRMFPVYYLFLEDTNQFLLSARRRKKSASSNYIVSTDQSDTARNSDNFIAKVRSNFLGSEFHIFDKGDNPKLRSATPRKELAVVTYATNVLGMFGPRQIRAYIPALDDDGEMIANPATGGSNALNARAARGDTTVFSFESKKASYNEVTKKYVLDFKKRVKEASSKNFQLVAANSQDVLFQFGRTNDLSFILDFAYPFSPLQAYGIAITSFDSKLVCE